MTKNKNSTKYYSNIQENTVADNLNGNVQYRSGAGKFRKGDVIHQQASMLIECKTTMKDKTSFSIKKEWIKKNKEEAFTQRVSHSCIAFNFGPNQPNYYVIDEDLMQYLIDQLTQETL